MRAQRAAWMTAAFAFLLVGVGCGSDDPSTDTASSGATSTSGTGAGGATSSSSDTVTSSGVGGDGGAGGRGAVCGNGVAEAGEDCDDGGESATCNADCTTASCGDGVLNTAAGEACDDGGESATCNADCSAASCGDGVVNASAGETCDDMGESAACNADCTDAACGDGVVNMSAGESCDDAGESAACNADCSAASCGDGLVNMTAGEACDDTGESAACNADCSAASCGDGKVNATAGEACDDSGESAACNADCSAASCGDGKVNATAGEACDDSGESAACNADCSVASCGDGKVNASAGETCDGMGETATCNSDCSTASCGDGKVNATAGEACDDMGESAACDTDCTAALCGDGTINLALNEACDDGGESAACNVDCTVASCGDGTVNVTAGETCDDGNGANGDGCSVQCAGECAQDALTTLFSSGFIFNGNMFDITIASEITVTNFDLNLDLGSHDIEIYMKAGTYVGSEANAAAWTLVGSATGVIGNGAGVPTPFPAPVIVNITPGTVGVYVTTTGASNVNYVSGTLVGQVAATDGTLSIAEGNSINYPFGSTNSPRIWNGTIHYSRALTTTFAGGNGLTGGGNMFNVIAANDITIDGFWANVDAGPHTFEIYYVPGGYGGHEADSTAWTFAGSVSGVATAGTDIPTFVPINPSITMNAGDTFGLYITTTTTPINYTNGASEGAVLVQDANITITQGKGVGYPFGGTFTPRNWNGILQYSLCP